MTADKYLREALHELDRALRQLRSCDDLKDLPRIRLHVKRARELADRARRDLP